tara:strand:- start:43 stop:510 length:468 start_codon:yes stop_codon:yes gene_type:complete
MKKLLLLISLLLATNTWADIIYLFCTKNDSNFSPGEVRDVEKIFGMNRDEKLLFTWSVLNHSWGPPSTYKENKEYIFADEKMMFSTIKKWKINRQDLSALSWECRETSWVNPYDLGKPSYSCTENRQWQCEIKTANEVDKKIKELQDELKELNKI